MTSRQIQKNLTRSVYEPISVLAVAVAVAAAAAAAVNFDETL